MDANFRLKNLIRSSPAKDPGLHTGFAYFAPDEPYRQHVLKYASQKDVSFHSLFGGEGPYSSFVRLAIAVVSKPWRMRILSSPPDCDRQAWACVYVPVMRSLDLAALVIFKKAKGTNFPSIKSTN